MLIRVRVVLCILYIWIYIHVVICMCISVGIHVEIWLISICLWKYIHLHVVICMCIQVDNHVDTCGCCVIYWAGLRGACWLVTSTAWGMSCMCRQSVSICAYHDLLHANTYDIPMCSHAWKRYTYLYVPSNTCTYLQTDPLQPKGTTIHDFNAHTCICTHLYTHTNALGAAYICRNSSHTLTHRHREHQREHAC